MIAYKAGYKYVDGGIHAQVLDFPEVINCADVIEEARRLLSLALLDMAETRIGLGQSLPAPDAQATDAEMDVEEPIYLHMSVSTEVTETPAGQVAT